MTDDWLYVTAGGGHWHRRPDCEALLRGQEEARSKGASTHPVQHVPASAVGSRSPCGWCAPARRAVPESVQAPLMALRVDTDYERLFRDEVLGRLPEVSDWTMQSQRDVTVAGRAYRVDFALTDGPDRIAIEIDGEVKGPNSPTHDEWTHRQTALVAEGWTVLRFTNRQVRDGPEECRRTLAVTVARLRERRLQPATERPTPPTSPPAAPPQVPSPEKSNRGALTLVMVALVAIGGLVWLLQNGSGRQDPSLRGEDQPVPPSSASLSVGEVAPVTAASGWVSCPEEYPIKGNDSVDGDRIYHVTGGEFYDKTKPERCFADESSAQLAGYRAAER